MSFGANWVTAIKRAIASWDPAKHPRGRDGKFIEVGDMVKVFSGPTSPQIDSGKVVGGHLYEDGRFFVAVKSTSTGKIAWYRPKQIEAMHPKADLKPNMPIPDVGNKEAEHVDWEDEDLAHVKEGVDVLGKAYSPALDPGVPADQKKHTINLLADAPGTGSDLGKDNPSVASKVVIAEKAAQLDPEGAKGKSPWWTPPITDKPPAMDLIVPDGQVWHAMAEALTNYDEYKPEGAPDDPGMGFAKNGVDIVVYDIPKAAAAAQAIGEVQEQWGDGNVGQAIFAKVFGPIDTEAAKLAPKDYGFPKGSVAKYGGKHYKVTSHTPDGMVNLEPYGGGGTMKVDSALLEKSDLADWELEVLEQAKTLPEPEWEKDLLPQTHEVDPVDDTFAPGMVVQYKKTGKNYTVDTVQQQMGGGSLIKASSADGDEAWFTSGDLLVVTSGSTGSYKPGDAVQTKVTGSKWSVIDTKTDPSGDELVKIKNFLDPSKEVWVYAEQLDPAEDAVTDGAPVGHDLFAPGMMIESKMTGNLFQVTKLQDPLEGDLIWAIDPDSGDGMWFDPDEVKLHVEELQLPPVPDKPAAPAIKLPKGQTPADAIKLINTSASNKNLPPAALMVVNDNINAALAEPDQTQALKYLSVAMTLAKLGGKQRARYKTLLAMHRGESPGVAQTPKSPVGAKAKNGLGIIRATIQPGMKVASMQQANDWVHWHGSPGAAKGTIQTELAKRLADVPDAEWSRILFDSPGIHHAPLNPGSMLGNLKQAALGEAPPGAKLHKMSDGMWTASPSAIGAQKTLDLTPENLGVALRESAVNSLIALWAASSNDHNPRSLAMQEAAQAEFQLDPDWIFNWHSKPDQYDEHVKVHMETYRAFLRAQYEYTQQELKKQGWTHLRVRRGVSAAPTRKTPSGTSTVLSQKGEVGSVLHRPMSSVAAHQATVNKFGEHQQEMVVPIDRIIGSARTGFGCQNEYEYVILAGPNEILVHKNGYGY